MKYKIPDKYDKWIVYVRFDYKFNIVEPRMCYIIDEQDGWIAVQIYNSGIQMVKRESIKDSEKEVQDFIKHKYTNGRIQ